MGSGPYLIHTATNNVVPFNGSTVFTIGRSGDCNLDIAAIYISRKQCRIELLRNVGWVLFDESRFKTTKINNESLTSPYTVLNDGDKISFTPNSSSHEYTFHCQRHDVPKKKRKRDDELTQVSDVASTPGSEEPVDNERMSPLDLLREMATQSSFSLVSPKKCRNEEYEKMKKDKLMLELQLKLSKENLEANNITVCLLETENKNLQGRLEELQEKNRELMERMDAVHDESEEGETRGSVGRSDWEEQLSQLKTQVASSQVENSELKDTLSDAEKEIENLLKERCCKLIKFGADMNNCGNTSMDTLAEVELSLMKEDLKELTKKNLELSTNVETLRLEKEEYSNKINNVIDSELYCSICSDLMYQAVNLQCKHTFCKMCIEEWKKKKRECPVCRTKIKAQVPCLIIDSFIDKIADTIGGEIKTRREEIIKERTEAAAAAATPRSNKRKRATNFVPVPPFPHLDPIIEHLEIGFANPLPWDNQFPVGPFFDVVDLTRGSPPHPPFRGFERHGRRRRR